MAVPDVESVGSPGWWMQRLSTKLLDRRRQKRLRLLQSYYDGQPPLPHGAENSRTAYEAFQRKARTNFAELIIEAPRSRMQLRSIRTSAANDIKGDALAMQIWRSNSMAVRMIDVWTWMLTLGESYAILGLPGDNATSSGEFKIPVITQEHPSQTITEHDPVTGREIAGLKLFHDDIKGFDYSYLWLPGKRYVAQRENALKSRRPPKISFSAASFTMNDDLYQEWNSETLGVIRFLNRNAKGEYENHLDLLDRINHMILQRMVIATFQAFRQRALMVDPADMPETDPETGEAVDYDQILAGDPGALWKLPSTAKLWESGQVDLQPILSSVKDDVLHLSAVTRTPLTMFTPDAATQTAEGAELQREGQTAKVEDLHVLGDDHVSRMMSVAFEFAGASDRADPSTISTDWRPAERYSLAERAAGGVQAAQAGVPWRARMEDIFQYDPDEVDRLEAQRMDDAVFAQTTGIPEVPTPPIPKLASTADRLAKQIDHVA